MSTKTAIIEIYTEYTPNPESLKFVTNRMILPNRSLDFKTKDEAEHSPLALALFDLPYVAGVFIANNFVTVTKQNAADWIHIIPQVKDLLRSWITEEKEVVTASEEVSSEPLKQEGANDLEQKIIDTLDKYVRPAVEMDGGNIIFKSFDAGVVTLTLQGSCSGCPSSTVTLKQGIEGLLQRMVPEVTEVVAEEG